MTRYKWIRVTKANPCVVCDHDGWCSYCPELNLALCMRIESNRPSKNAMGGYLWKLSDKPIERVQRTLPLEPQPEPQVDFEQIWKSCKEQTTPQQLIHEAELLGVDYEALYWLGAVWHQKYKAWGFPMRNAEGKIVGIRLRTSDGKKWAVKGSKQGLFIPNFLLHQDGNI